MSERSAPELIQAFRAALAQDDLTDLAVVYEVSGGVPSEEFEALTAAGSVRGKLSLVGSGDLTTTQDQPKHINPVETRDLLQQVASSLDSLIPRDQARFLPDSVVGSVTIVVRGEEATFYFLADEGQRQGQDERIARGASEAIRPLRELWRRIGTESERGR
jgi:hypothetical protein